VNTKTSVVALACVIFAMPWGAGCAADEAAEEDTSSDAEELGAGLAAPTASNSLLIAFDGTGNVRPDKLAITKDESSSVYNLYASAVVNGTKESPANKISNQAALNDSKYTYNFWKRFDAAGVTKAIYFSGPPRPGASATDNPTTDSGAKAILDAAFTHNVSSPVCDAIQQSSIKNVYLIGYSRGGVLAHEVALRVGKLKRCGAEAAKKLKWVGLIDPVDTGMSAYKAKVVSCESAKFWKSWGNGPANIPGLCLDQLTVPVVTVMKDQGANRAASGAWLATIPVKGSRIDEANYSGAWGPTIGQAEVVGPHIDMGAKNNEVVIQKIKASAKTSGLRM
jgi:pimeloyl-ACP methyl ester carboxylesterase